MDDVESRDDPDRYLGTAPLVVRGHAIPVGAPKGEDLPSAFRRLVPAHRDLLFGDNAEVRRRLPADLPQLLQLLQLLQLEELNQPDLFQAPPSQSET